MRSEALVVFGTGVAGEVGGRTVDVGVEGNTSSLQAENDTSKITKAPGCSQPSTPTRRRPRILEACGMTFSLLKRGRLAQCPAIHPSEHSEQKPSKRVRV